MSENVHRSDVETSARLIEELRHQSLRPATTEIAIRSVPARCGGCGGSKFHAPQAPFAIDDSFVCAKCQRQSSYGDLLDSIGEEAIRQARQALGSLREKRMKRRLG